MAENLRKKTTKGLVWSAIERFSVQGVQFLVMIVMARLLMPEDYGLIGMLAIFMAISQSLIDSGFAQALIRKQDRTDVDKSTVFYFNIIVGAVLYLVLYFSAPFVSEFYKKPELCDVMRVLCLAVFFRSFTIVQRAELTIRLDFSTQAAASLVAAIISGVVGISLAYMGFGVWALVAQQLTVAILTAIFFWFVTGWRPIRAFSKKSFNELFSFGSKLLASGLLNTIYNNLYPLIIGRVFSADLLGHYTRAQHFSAFPSSNLTGILQRVTYPVLCEIQNEEERLSKAYRKFLKLAAFVVFPLMMLLASLSEPLILSLIGSQWMFCSVLLTIICFDMMWHPVHAINLNLLQVKGRSDLFLRLEIIKKILGVSILFFSFRFGLIIMCYCQILSSVLCLIINTYYTGQLIGVGFFKQMKDLFPTLVLSISMFVIVYFVKDIVEDNILKLSLGLSIGVIYFMGVAILMKFEELKDIKSVIKRK